MACCILARSVRIFSRRYAAASLRLRGFFSAALRAASASRRLGVGRPFPPGLPWDSAGTVVAVSDLVRRNTGSDLIRQGRSRIGVVPGPDHYFIGAGPDGVVTRGDIGWLARTPGRLAGTEGVRISMSIFKRMSTIFKAKANS